MFKHSCVQTAALQVDIPAFVLFFGAVFLGSLAFWRLAWRLPMPKASLLASCCMSVAHALVVCVVGFQQLQEWKHFDLDMPNTAQHVSGWERVLALGMIGSADARAQRVAGSVHMHYITP